MDESRVSYGIDLLTQIEKLASWKVLKAAAIGAIMGAAIFGVGDDTGLALATGIVAFLLVGLSIEIQLRFLRLEWSRFASEFPDLAKISIGHVDDMKRDRKFWRWLY
jgi:hypothetical protein